VASTVDSYSSEMLVLHILTGHVRYANRLEPRIPGLNQDGIPVKPVVGIDQVPL
jgi:hypothetical protein